jgi:hypothetical protein
VDATAPAVVAAAPDFNTDSWAGRFTTCPAAVADGVEQPAGLPGAGQGGFPATSDDS